MTSRRSCSSPGDLTYANATGQGQAAVDQHFNDVMAWSQSAAYMPAWGNHESDDPGARRPAELQGALHAPARPGGPVGAPALGCCGEDWGWFDAGGVRFISYPRAYTTARPSASGRRRSTRCSPRRRPTRTSTSSSRTGTEPAYSTGFHAPACRPRLRSSTRSGAVTPSTSSTSTATTHDYERFQPIHGVTHITTGGATNLETPWVTTDPRTAFRAFHLVAPARRREQRRHPHRRRLRPLVVGRRHVVPAGHASGLGRHRNASAAAAGRAGAVRRQRQPDLLGHRPRNGRASRSARSARRRRRVSPGQTVEVAFGNLCTATSPSRRRRPRSSPIVFTAAPGATVTVDRGRERLRALEHELGHDQRLRHQLDDRRRHLRPELVEHRHLGQPRQLCRPAGQRAEQIGHLLQHGQRLARLGQHRRSQHELRHLPQRLDRNLIQGKRELQQRAGLCACSLRHPALQLDRQHGRREPHT